MAEHWRLPPIGQGWQTYQPPLYYVVTAAMGWVTPRALQDFGLAVAVLTLAIGLAVLHEAIPERLVAGAPLASVATGLALLTKNVGFLLPPILSLVLLLRPSTAWKSKFRLGLVAIAIAGSLSGWLAVRRSGGEAQRDLVGNVGALSPSLRVAVAPETLFAFDPIRVLREPYVNPFVAGRKRDRVGEYVLRTSRFGEFTLATVPRGAARALVLLALATGSLSAMGAVRGIRKRWEDAAPMTAVALLGVTAALAYLPAAPFSTSMDFRYLTLLLLPGTAFLAAAPGGRVRDGLVGLFAVLSAVTGILLAV